MKKHTGTLFTSVLGLTILMAGCGGDGSGGGALGGNSTDNEIQDINNKINQLTQLTGSLNSLIQSDFATCPSSGDTADPLINKICKVAQAATVEVQVALQDQLGQFANMLQSQIVSAQTDLANQQSEIDSANANIAANSSSIASAQAAIAAANAQIAVINSNVTSLQTSVTTLQGQMSSANAAISALQSLTNSINTTLNGTMISVSIGSENVAAGPMYEAVLRRLDKTIFNGYVAAYGALQSFGANPITATNGSANAVFALTAHGYNVGDIVVLGGLTSGRGFLTGDVTGQYTISAVTTNTFTIVLPRVATSSGTLGGSNGTVQKLSGIGMATLWQSGQVSDSAVRITTSGSKVYNFIIRRISTDSSNNTAELCYDKTNNAATFATINAAPAGGSGNIVCK